MASSVVIDAVDKVIERTCSASPFDGLHTVYLQQQYFQKHFHFVVSSRHCAFGVCIYICTCSFYVHVHACSYSMQISCI